MGEGIYLNPANPADPIKRIGFIRGKIRVIHNGRVVKPASSPPLEVPVVGEVCKFRPARPTVPAAAWPSFNCDFLSCLCAAHPGNLLQSCGRRAQACARAPRAPTPPALFDWGWFIAVRPPEARPGSCRAHIQILWARRLRQIWLLGPGPRGADFCCPHIPRRRRRRTAAWGGAGFWVGNWSWSFMAWGRAWKPVTHRGFPSRAHDCRGPFHIREPIYEAPFCLREPFVNFCCKKRLFCPKSGAFLLVAPPFPLWPGARNTRSLAFPLWVGRQKSNHDPRPPFSFFFRRRASATKASMKSSMCCPISFGLFPIPRGLPGSLCGDGLATAPAWKTRRSGSASPKMSSLPAALPRRKRPITASPTPT